MSWRVLAAVFTVIFLTVVLQSAFAAPLEAVSDGLSDATDGDLQNPNLNDNVFQSLPNTWYNMGLIVIFGITLWGTARILRRELTRGGL